MCSSAFPGMGVAGGAVARDEGHLEFKSTLMEGQRRAPDHWEKALALTVGTSNVHPTLRWSNCGHGSLRKVQPVWQEGVRGISEHTAHVGSMLS